MTRSYGFDHQDASFQDNLPTLWIAAYKWSSGIIPLSCQSQVFSQHCFVHFLPPQVICTVLVIKERVGNWIPCLIINAIQNSKKLS
jgi:hypothetical protein